MGLIQNLTGDALENRQQECFRCEVIPANVLVMKGRKFSGSGRNKTGINNNTITSGAVLAVAEGQCVMIVDRGRILECSAEPGLYTYDASTSSSFFCRDPDNRAGQSFIQMDRCCPSDSQPCTSPKVYYFNTKVLTGNRCVTSNPIPFHVADKRIGVDAWIAVHCTGEFSYRICDPVLFYKHVCGDVNKDFYKDSLDARLKIELLSALDGAFAKLSQTGMPYSELTDNSPELTDALNAILASRWRENLGLELTSFSISHVRVSEQDEALIRKLQEAAAFRRAHWAAQSAQENPMRALDMPRRVPGKTFAPENGWKCSCGSQNDGNFCPHCGRKKPKSRIPTGNPRL